MDEAQVQALITAAMGEFKTSFAAEFSSIVDKKNQGLAANLSREIKALSSSSTAPKDEAGDDKPSDGKLSMKALQTQIGDLTKQLTEEKEAKFKSASNAALTAAIADSGAQNTSTLRKLLAVEYGGKLKEENGNWFVSDGDNATALADSLKSYLATDEGKIFVPPTGTNGAGSRETRSTAPATGNSGTVSDAALSEAFAGI